MTGPTTTHDHAVLEAGAAELVEEQLLPDALRMVVDKRAARGETLEGEARRVVVDYLRERLQARALACYCLMELEWRRFLRRSGAVSLDAVNEALRWVLEADEKYQQLRPEQPELTVDELQVEIQELGLWARWGWNG